jgi:hypothetical protein
MILRLYRGAVKLFTLSAAAATMRPLRCTTQFTWQTSAVVGRLPHTPDNTADEAAQAAL